MGVLAKSRRSLARRWGGSGVKGVRILTHSDSFWFISAESVGGTLTLALSQRRGDYAFAGNDGGCQECVGVVKLFKSAHFRSFPRPRLLPRGVNPGPIWPCLASFTPSGEAGNEATVASVGPPLTRRHWASWPWLWPWLASSGVARSGETFNSVAFGCISLLSLSSTRGRDARFPPSRERRGHSRNDACRQCRGWRGDGAMGSCRWIGVEGRLVQCFRR